MKSFCLRATLLAAVSCSLSVGQPVIVPWPTPSKTPLNVTMGYGVVRSTGTRFNWYAAVLDDLSHFEVALPAGGCANRDTTTNSARSNGCALSTNLGPFSYTKPYCLGEIVANSTIINWDGDGAPLLAMTAQKTTIMGNLSKDDIAAQKVTFGASGFGFVVSNGQMDHAGIREAAARIRAHRGASQRVAGGEDAANPPKEEVAGRSVAALDSAGRLLLVIIDGVETLDLGLTLTELSEVFAKGAIGFPYTATHAINFDGGGSTTMSASPLWPLPAQAFNRPTATDYAPIGERQVTSISCIKPFV